MIPRLTAVDFVGSVVTVVLVVTVTGSEDTLATVTLEVAGLTLRTDRLCHRKRPQCILYAAVCSVTPIFTPFLTDFIIIRNNYAFDQWNTNTHVLLL